jgi:hypothetical protein
MDHGTLFEPMELSCGMFSIGTFLSRIVVSAGFEEFGRVGGMVNGEKLRPDRVGIVTVVAWLGCVGIVCCYDGEQDGQANVAHNL